MSWSFLKGVLYIDLLTLSALYCLKKTDTSIEKRRTKGRFGFDYKTCAGSWMQDREWKKRANPAVWRIAEKTEAQDLKMMEKRKK